MSASLLDGAVQIIVGISVPVLLAMLQGWLNKNKDLKDIQISKEQSELIQKLALDAWAEAKAEMDHRAVTGVVSNQDQFSLAKASLAQSINNTPSKINSSQFDLVSELQKVKQEADNRQLVIQPETETP